MTVDQVRSVVQTSLHGRNAVDDFRAYVRANPGDPMKTGDMGTANSLLEFAKLGPDKRDLQPVPSVDRAIHKAVGLQDDKYVPQEKLDELARTTRENPSSLLARGLSKEDVNAVAGFLSRTGRDSYTPTGKERLVVGGDEWRPRTPEEHVQHQRMEGIHNITESPLTVSISKFLGLTNEQAYAAGRMATLLTDMGGAHLEATGRRGAGGVDPRAGERNQAEVRPQEGTGSKPGLEVKSEAWMNARRDAPKDARAEQPLHTGAGEVPHGAQRGDQNAGRLEPRSGYGEAGKAPDLKPGTRPTPQEAAGVAQPREGTPHRTPDKNTESQRNNPGHGSHPAIAHDSPAASPKTETIWGQGSKTQGEGAERAARELTPGTHIYGSFPNLDRAVYGDRGPLAPALEVGQLKSIDTSRESYQGSGFGNLIVREAGKIPEGGLWVHGGDVVLIGPETRLVLDVAIPITPLTAAQTASLETAIEACTSMGVEVRVHRIP